MANKNIPFFATGADISSLAKAINLMHPVQFVVAGLFDTPVAEVSYELVNPMPLTTYLVVDRNSLISIRTVPQRGGGVKYAIDQMQNSNATSFRFGGFLEDRLVAGQFGASESNELSSIISKLMRKQFEKIKSYYVGPEAVRLLDSGVRLTPTSKSPETYELAPEKRIPC